MFCLAATSPGQEGFRTLFCGNLPFQKVSFSDNEPDQGEQVHFGAGVSLSISWERDCSFWLVLGNHTGSKCGTAVLTHCGWTGAGCPSKTPLFHFHFCFHASSAHCVLLISLSFSVCFSFSFISLTSFFHMFSLLLLIQCVLPLYSSSKIVATTLHCQHSGFLTLLDHWAMLWAQPLQQTCWINLIPDFFWLLCYRKGCFGHEDLRLVSCALPEET